MTIDGRITGTFLDGMASDIPSQNCGSAEWTAQFNIFTDMSMDTLVIIRCVTDEHAIYPTKTAAVPLVYDDLAELFFTLADERRMNVYLGTYDTFHHWFRNDWASEVKACLPFIDEAESDAVPCHATRRKIPGGQARA